MVTAIHALIIGMISSYTSTSLQNVYKVVECLPFQTCAGQLATGVNIHAFTQVRHDLARMIALTAAVDVPHLCYFTPLMFPICISRACLPFAGTKHNMSAQAKYTAHMRGRTAPQLLRQST